ncbi:RraA family protein [Dactylosporangium sp. CA-092794]|uniref:RraA family protein n=1 Tax=Dactylosporangium sp. CA-092794 TaxID=3239929 RepID=UPI003D926E7E
MSGAAPPPPAGEDPWAELFRTAAALGTATLHEAAGQVGVVDPAVVRMTPGLVASGPAFPVYTPPGDNLWLHRAVYAARPGDVLVVSTGGGFDFGYWGEVLSYAAAAREIAGAIIDGCVRDVDELAAVGVPVFARGLCIRGTGKDPDGAGTLGEPVRVGDITISRGDFVLGDGDGVFALPMARLADVVALGRQRRDREHDIIKQLHAGARTLDLYDLPGRDLDDLRSPDAASGPTTQERDMTHSVQEAGCA